MLPLLRGFSRDGVVTWHHRRPITAAQFCGAARRLAADLPSARFAVNLCEEGTNFVLGSAAALIAGQTLLFPPSRLSLPLADIRRAYADSYCLVDPGAAAGSDRVGVNVDRALAASNASWPPPLLDSAHVAAILFTSGSTREPQPHAKTWDELVNGSGTLVRSFGSPPRGAAVVGTVAPQHMFGFETTVMLPLQSGTPVLEVRPAYPADLAQVLAFAAERDIGTLWLMTTPLQLRAFHRGLASVRGLRQIITATMALERELARAVERDWDTRVDEIFGCTEGGILATRRPAETSEWTPAAGLEFSLAADGSARVEGGHLPRPLMLSDRIALRESPEAGSNKRFELLGRDQDIVKIAGKRASLAGLNAQAIGIPGVSDAAFFLPEPTVSRLAAILVAPGHSPANIRAELAQRIDPAFLPRPLLVVGALARDPNGKIPLNALLDILRAAEQPRTPTPADRTIVLEHQWSVAADHPALAGHFPGRPIIPGVVLLQAVESVLAVHGLRIRTCVQIKFHATVAPASPLSLRAEITAGPKARFVISAAGQTAVSGVLLCSRSRIEA
jgi:acyl-coenzyme A synthetase/AMP-(fatty) acid ligase